MKKIDWAAKLTSRKLWLAVAGLVAGLVIACNGQAETAETVTGLITSLGSVVAYIIGEGLVDSNRVATVEEEKVEDIGGGGDE